MEEDVRYGEALFQWKRQVEITLTTLSPDQRDRLREWQSQSGGREDISQWPGWEDLIGKRPVPGREERARFREDRLAKIAAGETPVPLDHVPRVIVHMMPHKKQELELASGVDREAVATHLAPMVARYMPANEYGTTVSDEGIITYSSGAEGVSSYAYSQLFPDGSIEHVRASYYMPEDDVVNAVSRGLVLQEKLRVEAPIVVTLSLVGLAGSSLRDGSRPVQGEPIDRDEIKIGEVIFSEHKPRSNNEIGASLKHAFDAVRRAGHMQPRRA
jgi:hypothetical protein